MVLARGERPHTFQGVSMAYEIAKAVLEQAQTPVERVKAIRVACSLGMPLQKIEEYLDWLDAVRRPQYDKAEGPNAPGKSE